MDTYIIFKAMIGFISFVLTHLVLSFIFKSKIGINQLFLIFCLIGIILFGIDLSTHLTDSILTDIFISLLSVVIYGLSIFLYILGFWGLLVSSIRFQLIREIYNFGKNHISRIQLNKQYNNQILVKDRLDRLVKNGELIKYQKHYTFGKPLSYFSTHAKIQQLLVNWYN